MFSKGEKVYYIFNKKNKKPVIVEILKAYQDLEEPFYLIKFNDGREKNTVPNRLIKINDYIKSLKILADLNNNS